MASIGADTEVVMLSPCLNKNGIAFATAEVVMQKFLGGV